jgi:type I restriction enzyme S subunit
MVSGKMIGLTPKITTVLPRILAGVLATREPQKYLDQRTTGMAESQVNFTNEVLLSTPIRVPAMREQRRIAEILDTVDDAIHSTDRLIRKLELTKQGLLDDLLTRGLDERGELRDPDRHPGQFIRTAIGPLPAAWELLPVHRHFDAKLGKMLSPASKTGRQMFPYLANRNVQWDRLDLSDLDEMEFSGQEREKYQLEFGDVLVCEGGEVGRTAVWRNAMPNCYFQKAVHRLRSRGEILPEYFSAYMRFAASTGRFSHLSSQTSIAHLTAEKLAQLLVPTPSVGEQRSIVGLLMAASEQSAGCSAERDKLRVLKAGLMDDLLTGRVHVSSAEHAA